MLLGFLSESFSQKKDTINIRLQEFNKLLNYIPKSVEFDEFSITKAISGKIQTIDEFMIFSYSREFIEFSEDKSKKLKAGIEKLAKSFYLDGKNVIISKTGGYSGCIDKLIDTIKLKNINIINLKFCNGCNNWNRDDYFIKTFNSKMYELMNIKAPDYYTYHFHGEFINKKKNSSFKKLELNKDRTFKLWQIFNGNLVSYSGFWENSDTILELDLSKYDELNNLKLKYNIYRGKITGINVKNIKFKKPD